MWKLIFKHEWRSLSADKTLWIVAALLLAVVGYGVWNGAAWANFQTRTINAAVADERKTFDEKRSDIAELDAGSKEVVSWLDPRSPAVTGGSFGGGRYAFMPPAPLAAFSVGQSDLYPYYFKVSLQSKQAFLATDEIENPHNLLAGKFDLSFVVVYLVPLVILALSFNLLSGEREAGTLALTMSQPVSLWSLIIGKIAARFALVLSVVVLCAVVVGVLSGGVNFGAEGAWLRFLFWIVAVTFYSAFWFALAVLVNALGKGSATNAIVLAGLWLLFVLIAPALINAAANSFYPVPSRVEMVQATRRATDVANKRAADLLGKYLQDHPELVQDSPNTSLEDFYSRRIAVEDETERQTAPVTEHFNAQLAGQQRIAGSFQYLSPSIVAQTVFNDLAGTSEARYADFLAQVDGHHQNWRKFYYPKILAQTKLSPADYDAMPRFAYKSESSSAVLSRAAIGLFALFLPSLIVAFLAFAALRRYRLAG